MKDFKLLLKGVAGKQSPKALAAYLSQAGHQLGSKLSEAVQKQRSSLVARIILAVILIGLIIGVTNLSYAGAGFIFSYGGPVSLVFGLLDITLVLLLLVNVLKGGWKYGALAFEILSFVYFGYTINGYFSAGSLQSIASKNISEMYSQANDVFVDDANTLNMATEQVKQSAASIKKIEEARDGKGVVAEKAAMVSEIETKEIPDLPATPVTPSFSSLPDANQWIQSQAAVLNQKGQEYQSLSKALINQAEGYSKGISSTLGQGGLSANQISSLHSLQESLGQIANYELKNTEIKANTLKSGDFQVEGMQKVLGYTVEGVMVFFLVMLMLLGNNEAKMEELRQEAGLAIIQDYLDEKGISYEDLEKLDYKTLVTVVSMTTAEDEVFLKYVKGAKLDDIVTFVKKSPVLGNAMVSSKWRFSEIKKVLDADRTLEALMPEIIQIKKADWDVLSQHNEPEAVLAMSIEMREKFLGVVDVLKSKIVNEAELKELIKKLVKGGPSAAYYETLMIFCEKMPANKLQLLTKGFVLGIHPEVAKMVITYSDDLTQLSSIISGWDTADNDVYKEIDANSVSKDSSFGPLMRILINSSGIDGLRKFASLFREVSKKATQNGLGEMVAISQEKLAEVRESLQKGEAKAVATALAGILETKSRLA